MNDTPYLVLARKYRPATFADLIGQDTMVRTLRNAFQADRIAQAFIMTGIRGTGKTTTARIIAKGMNCIGPDGTGGPTVAPCGVCDPCRAIAEGRHVDVLEMDGASQTGVNDIRDNVIASVQYAPASARYKIYIIDEVHMLSTNAFNALLKTLEEPPPHVKFIFATTEIRKVPVTVLSRCQRFDLRRIEPETMIAHLRAIADREGAQIADDALALIVRAAEGSVRDALSLLDQAIGQNPGGQGSGETSADQVRAMLGLADRGRVMDLFDAVMRGDAAGALGELGAQYADGADPMAVLRDLAEITHWVSVVKITPDAADDPTIGPDERARGRAMAEALPMRVMTRMWQMLLKALEEVAQAPSAMMAAEMAVIRLTHVADLPPPEDLLRKLAATTPPAAAPAPAETPAGGGGGASALRTTSQALLVADVAVVDGLARFATFAAVIGLIRANRDQKLLLDVETYVQLARYVPGRIEFQPTDDAPRDLAARLSQRLQTWTGARWTVSVVDQGGAPTIRADETQARRALEAGIADHPMMVAVRAAFPDAALGIKLRQTHAAKLALAAAEAAVAALPDVPDEWDPFEDRDG